jgi:hypothetical protein
VNKKETEKGVQKEKGGVESFSTNLEVFSNNRLIECIWMVRWVQRGGKRGVGNYNERGIVVDRIFSI